MKIVLLRHGPPDFDAPWLTSGNEVMGGLEAYAASRVTTQAPEAVRGFSSQFAVCITSELARAIDSAKLLGFNNSSALKLFNESELPYPNRLYIPLPWSGFLAIYRILWFFGFKKNCSGRKKDQERARSGGKYLSEVAAQHDSVLHVGHGIMLRLLCSELQKLGWSVESKTGSGYWSSIVMVRDGT